MCELCGTECSLPLPEVGVCGMCHAVGGYHHENMILMSDRPSVDWLSKPDVYEGDTWYCQGCGSSTSRTISISKAKKVSQ